VYEKNSEATGTMFTLEFKVKDDATIGSTANLGFSANLTGFITQQESSKYDATADALTVKVVCKEADHKYGEPNVDKAATCTEAGSQTSTCSVCGKTKVEELTALGHIKGEMFVDKEATATEKGSQHYVCKNCGETKTEDIPALGSNDANDSNSSSNGNDANGSNNLVVTGSDNKGDNKGDDSASGALGNDAAANGSDAAANGSANGTNGTTNTVNGNTKTGDTAPLMALVVAGLAAAAVVTQRKRILGR
jgi:hypothetical protein